MLSRPGFDQDGSAKHLLESMNEKTEILRLAPQHDIVGEMMDGKTYGVIATR